jgi:ribosomal protein S18 acetylase RimI-like enzyme
LPDLRPGPLTVLARAPTRLKARGPGEVLELLWGRLKESVSSQETLVFLARTAGALPVAPAAKWGDLSFSSATERDADDYARWIGTDSPRTFSARLSPDTRCYLVRHGERVVHATWVTTTASWLRELRRYFRVPEGDAYVYESFTRADARGMGVYPFALTEICAALDAEGAQRVWVGVEHSNAPSLRAITKAGFEPSFEVHYARRWGRIRVQLSENAHSACPKCLEGTFSS